MTILVESLHITLVQTNLYWHSREANLAALEEKIWPFCQKTDLIVLPEMFSSGFTMAAAEVAEPMNLHTFKWLKQMALQTGAVITGSYAVKEKDSFFNRLIWIQPDGQYDCYDKRHLFRMANEHQTYSPGSQKIIKQLKGWNIMPLICYDLRFPVWSRNVELQYDLLLYVASWPKPRINAWDALLKARAIENLACVAAVNRVGTDGLGTAYNGHSCLIDARGDYLIEPYEEEEIKTFVLEKATLNEFRQKFPSQLDADAFDLHV